jgi:linoleoyl-CoA desaturase
VSSSAAATKLKFPPDEGFHRELKRRVDSELESLGVTGQDSPRMYLKTVVLLSWLWGTYALLVFGATEVWQGLLLSASLALAVSGIGFSVMHDANHGAYSKHAWVNRVLGCTLDMLGGSSYVWQWKHNVFHHTYPNVAGADDDLDVMPFARLAPEQPRRFLHRWQHFYLWPLYGMLAPKWHFVDDYKSVARGRISSHRFPRPTGWRLVEVIAGKLVFYSWALVVPMFFHRWWVVLAFYFFASVISGVVMAVVFQLAHCVEEAAFPATKHGELSAAWAVHQVETSVDFARDNPVLTWYLGGLNFQIEHHLFPKICHVYYRRIARIVEEVSAQFGVRYVAHGGIGPAIASHWRWLRHMGRAA